MSPIAFHYMLCARSDEYFTYQSLISSIEKWILGLGFTHERAVSSYRPAFLCLLWTGFIIREKEGYRFSKVRLLYNSYDHSRSFYNSWLGLRRWDDEAETLKLSRTRSGLVSVYDVLNKCAFYDVMHEHCESLNWNSFISKLCHLRGEVIAKKGDQKLSKKKIAAILSRLC